MQLEEALEVLKQYVQQQQSPRSDEELLAEFEQRYTATPGRIRSALSRLRRFKAFLGGKRLTEATVEDVRAYVRLRAAECRYLRVGTSYARAPGWRSCVKRHFVAQPPEAALSACVGCPSYEGGGRAASDSLDSLRAFFRLMADRVPLDPADILRFEVPRRGRYDENPVYCPDSATVAQVIQRAREPRTRAYLLVLAKTGRRPAEVLALTWPDIDLERGVIDMARVRRARLAGAGRGRVKMHAHGCRWSLLDEEAVAFLRAYRERYWERSVPRTANGMPLTEALWFTLPLATPSATTVQYWMEAALRDAGLQERHGRASSQPFYVKCFRHYFTTHLQMGAAPLPRELVKWLRGDSMRDAMQRYEHLPPEELRKRYVLAMPVLGVRW